MLNKAALPPTPFGSVGVSWEVCGVLRKQPDGRALILSVLVL